ncbi:hypothetical protein [Streptomyces sp. SID12488]|uniref:hypothetical protein n=1 Tax=Streptomyces sp. SID12488 TaxID=2706040 RepID=UPI0013DA177E|nr:hypothetical protein [Streptomyces sp. SID12488]NEA64430.1 hypothetical protein [Streptomyces sp. SID12488]
MDEVLGEGSARGSMRGAQGLVEDGDAPQGLRVVDLFQQGQRGMGVSNSSLVASGGGMSVGPIGVGCGPSAPNAPAKPEASDPTNARLSTRAAPSVPMRWKGAMNAFDLAFDGRLTAGQL